MRAALFTDRDPPVQVTDVDLASPREHEVKVQIAGGVCHSELGVPSWAGEAVVATVCTTQVSAGSTVAVVGCGGVGLNAPPARSHERGRAHLRRPRDKATHTLSDLTNRGQRGSC